MIKHLNDEEKQKLLKTLLKESLRTEGFDSSLSFRSLIKNRQMALLLYVLYETGARVNELLSVRFKDVQYKTPTHVLKYPKRKNKFIKLFGKSYKIEKNVSFHIKGLKGSNDRLVALSDLGSVVFYHYIKESRLTQTFRDDQTETPNPEQMTKEHKVFPHSYMAVYRAWRYFSPSKDLNLHALRHTRAIDIYKQSKDIHLAKYLLGHRSLGNTSIYVNYVESVEKINDVANLTAPDFSDWDR